MFSWGGNPGVGSLHRLRDAVERGWPRPLEIEEHSHSAMAHAYAAGAAGMPCAFFRGYLGSDLPRVNPNIRSSPARSPVKRLAAVPALRPDVAIVHAQKADREGNVLIEGIVGVQKEAVLAARRSIVTVEEVVDALPRRGQRRHPAVVDGHARSPWRRAARVRRTRTAITRATTRSTSRGTPSRAIATRSRRGWTSTCFAGRPTETGRDLLAGRDDDRRRGARAGERRRLFRRHRAAVGGLQPRAADARAAPDAGVRVRARSRRSRTCCRCRSATASCARRR